MKRRVFLKVAAALTYCPRFGAGAESDRRPLDGVVGFTTGSLSTQRRRGELTALTLPKFVRDELGMQMIDFNTNWLKSFDESYVSRVRVAADDAGCFFTNLKVNHDFGDLYDSTESGRRDAMKNARQLILAAKTLGARWIRFRVPKTRPTDDASKLAAHRELSTFAARHRVQLLVENLGWLQSDPDSIVRTVKWIGTNVAACPDTGNWDDDVRFDALVKSFPGAASCDFKVFELDDRWRHKKYDVHRCFEIGWKAGFRGPWAIEHWHKDSKAFAREMVFLRDQLKGWIAESG